MRSTACGCSLSVGLCAVAAVFVPSFVVALRCLTRRRSRSGKCLLWFAVSSIWASLMDIGSLPISSIKNLEIRGMSRRVRSPAMTLQQQERDASGLNLEGTEELVVE